MAAFFFALALLFLASFWPDFFWLAFGDLSPITFILVLRLAGLRHGIFSGGIHMVPGGTEIVNGRRNIAVDCRRTLGKGSIVTVHLPAWTEGDQKND